MITLKSHGFKFSRPEANFVFDVSYLKNPWRIQQIREENNKKKQKMMIMAQMMTQPETLDLVSSIAVLASTMDKIAPDENIVFAICCSAGEYRSPAVVEMVVGLLKDNGIKVLVEQSKNSKI